MKLLLLLLCIGLAFTCVWAESSAWSAPLPLVSNVFGSSMVLQRKPQSARIWGWSTVSDKVQLSLIDVNQKSEAYEATADADGKWMITFPPKPLGGPYTIIVRGANGNFANLTDVMFGDVYYCSGQSNMEFILYSAFGGHDAILASDAYPHIRIIQVPRVYPAQPYDPWTPNPVINGSISWVRASIKTTVGVSAVCWWNAMHMSNELNNTVPIGLVANHWPGTNIESWMSPQLSNSSGCGKFLGQSSLWNDMVYPFLPMTIRSMIWYQGEANVGPPSYDAFYGCVFPKFVEDYRTRFQSNFPFIYVQLAPLDENGDNWPRFRAMQFDLFRNEIENSCLVSTTELGDLTAPSGSIHSRVKEPVGYRAYLCTRKLVYGMSGTWNGPIPLCATADPTSSDITISFVEDTIGDGLVLSEMITCPVGFNETKCGWPWRVNNGSDWYTASYALSDDKTQVILSGDYVITNQSAVQIRYAWGAYSLPTVYNSLNISSPVYSIGLSDCPISASPAASSPSPTTQPVHSLSCGFRLFEQRLALFVICLMAFLKTDFINLRTTLTFN